jgi:hypothetical protein
MGEHFNQNAGVYVSGPRKPIALSRFVAGAFRKLTKTPFTADSVVV